MIFRGFGRVFKKTPMNYYQEALDVEKAILTRLAVLEVEMEYFTKAGLTVSSNIASEEYQRQWDLLKKLHKTSIHRDATETTEMLEREVGYVKTFMAKN